MFIYSLLGLTISEKWTISGLTTLIGLGMTFFMLTILICSIHLLRLILKGLEKNFPIKKSKIKNLFARKKTQNIVAEPINENASIEKTSVIDDEIAVVIEKTIKDYVSKSAIDGKPHDRIKILSIKEVTND